MFIKAHRSPSRHTGVAYQERDEAAFGPERMADRPKHKNAIVVHDDTGLELVRVATLF